jgi:hypothetical protein
MLIFYYYRLGVLYMFTLHVSFVSTYLALFFKIHASPIIDSLYYVLSYVLATTGSFGHGPVNHRTSIFPCHFAGKND